MSRFTFIDLFCGIGGFHQAMSDLGGECVYASDIDEDCRKTYEANYGIRPDGDITQVNAADIPAHDVLCGGFVRHSPRPVRGSVLLTLLKGHSSLT